MKANPQQIKIKLLTFFFFFFYGFADIQDESIWNAFMDCGRIEGVRVVRDRATGIGKGFGYVMFSVSYFHLSNYNCSKPF